MDTMEIQEKVAEFNAKCVKHNIEVAQFQALWADLIANGGEAEYDSHRGTSNYVNLAETVWSDTEEEWILDEQATLKKFAAVIQWAHKRGYGVEKKYTDDEFQVSVETPIKMLRFYSTRQVVCKRVEVGTKIVEAVPEHEEPVYEYKCDKVAFLKIEV